jgi:hypothetical protein
MQCLCAGRFQQGEQSLKRCLNSRSSSTNQLKALCVLMDTVGPIETVSCCCRCCCVLLLLLLRPLPLLLRTAAAVAYCGCCCRALLLRTAA